MHRAFVNPLLLGPTPNDPRFFAAEVPAANGITNARSLAKMCAACIGEVEESASSRCCRRAGSTRAHEA